MQRHDLGRHRAASRPVRTPLPPRRCRLPATMGATGRLAEPRRRFCMPHQLLCASQRRGNSNNHAAGRVQPDGSAAATVASRAACTCSTSPLRCSETNPAQAAAAALPGRSRTSSRGTIHCRSRGQLRLRCVVGQARAMACLPSSWSVICSRLLMPAAGYHRPAAGLLVWHVSLRRCGIGVLGRSPLPTVRGFILSPSGCGNDQALPGVGRGFLA